MKLLQFMLLHQLPVLRLIKFGLHAHPLFLQYIFTLKLWYTSLLCYKYHEIILFSDEAEISKSHKKSQIQSEM